MAFSHGADRHARPVALLKVTDRSAFKATWRCGRSKQFQRDQCRYKAHRLALDQRDKWICRRCIPAPSFDP